jgi:hypothetical protein
MVAVVGGLAAGELLERLMTAPPEGAVPVSITITDVTAPPEMGLNTLIDLSAGGCTVKPTDADVELSVAVSVTGVGELTDPTWNRNWPNAKPAGMVNVAGTGAAVGLLVERLTTTPPCGAGPVNWTETVWVSPFEAGSIATASDPTPGDVEGTTNERVADQAVFAGTPGAESPWVESTCQYFVPALSDVIVQLGPVIWLLTYSICENAESLATSKT